MGDFLPPQVIYQGKTPRCHPKFEFPCGWDITHSAKRWSNEHMMLQYINNIIVPYVKSQRELMKHDKPAVVIMDNFKGQVTPAVSELLDANDIHTCLLPPNTTDLLQPMDISVNKSVKTFLRDRFQEWYASQIVIQLSRDRG